MRQIYSPLDGFRSPFGRLMGGTAPFTPAVLFGASEPGVWYDPSDLTTLFQDTAGTTPVTTPGQTVALALDKSKGLVLGSELRGNGIIGSIGTAPAPATYSTTTGVGTASRTNSANQSFVSLPATTGLTYLITVQNTGSVEAFLFTGSAIGGAGASAGSITAGQTVSFRVASVSNGFCVAAAAAGTANFTVSSVKELPGFHATQATTASRPIYGINPVGGRRNLLVNSENFNTTSWTTRLADATLTHGIADPFGGTSAATLTGTGSIPRTSFSPGFTLPSGTAVVTSVWLRRRTGTGTVSIYNSGLSQSAATTVTLTSSWQRFDVAATIGYTGTQTPGIVLGTNGDAVDFYGFQFETGSTATAYQKVTTQYDVTEAGVASVSYLAFDGVDDFMVTPTITPGIDRAQVFAGVRKNSDAATGMVAEFGNLATPTAGSWRMSAANGAAADYSFASRGTTSAAATYTNAAVAAPNTSVLSGIGDISADITRLRVNGDQVAEALTDQGTGNYLAYPLYIGRRGGTTFPFNGQLYSLIVRFGTNLTTDTITSTETWVAGKTGIANWANLISPTIFARDETAVLDRFNQTIERRAV